MILKVGLSTIKWGYDAGNFSFLYSSIAKPVLSKCLMTIFIFCNKVKNANSFLH